MPASNVGQDLIALVKTDVLTAFGPPLLSFLQQIAAAGADPIKQGAAWIQLQGAIVGAAPTAIASLEGELAGALAAKLQLLMAGK